MGNPIGFKEQKREDFSYAPVTERIKNYNEFVYRHDESKMQTQASRCMDCGVPFCHSWNGCPLANIVPEFNDSVYKGKWGEALDILLSTNNFPEFTGRICPAICETACVLGINDNPVTIKNIEVSIIEKAFREGVFKPKKPSKRTGKKIAVVGSGPAGLATADQLNKAGHSVTIYERDSVIGGLVRQGIPNFKLDKIDVVQRRVDIMAKEGIEFITNAHIGEDIPTNDLIENYDAVIISTGASKPRDLPIKNRDAEGIYFAMEFLSQSNKRVEGYEIEKDDEILATDKDVVVIGGGDTGSDCVGTSIRQKAKSVTQIELLPKPPAERTDSMPWPEYPRIFRLSTSQAEGCTMDYNILSKSFIKNEEGKVTGINCVRIEWEGRSFKEIEGSEFVLKADIVFLAMGFLGPDQTGIIEELSLETDQRSNIKTDGFKTSVDKVFSAGDCRRGQSLVVWAIVEGRECAREVDEYLMGGSMLYSKNKSFCAV